MTEASNITAGQYIQHHLEHLTLNLKTFTIDGDSNGGFWTLNLDTFIVSIFLGILIFGGLRLVAIRMKEVPGKLQNIVEIILDFVNNSVHEIFHHKTTFIPSLALTIFLWIFAMNLMDLLPVDFLPRVFGFAPYFKSVPTADPEFSRCCFRKLIIFFNWRENTVCQKELTLPLGPYLPD